MKKLILLLPLVFLAGCSGPLYEAEIKEVKNICDNNNGIFKYRINVLNLNTIDEIICNDGAVFTRSQAIKTLEKRQEKKDEH